MRLSNLFRGMYTKIKFYQFIEGGGGKKKLKREWGSWEKQEVLFYNFFQNDVTMKKQTYINSI